MRNLLQKLLLRPFRAFAAAALTLSGLNLLVYLLPVNLLMEFGGVDLSRNEIINYAPEVWLSLLAFVFGTLIIVISIASESTPKLIDLFVNDLTSRFYIWIITMSILENVFLQLLHAQQTMFFDNLIFLNNYVLLPVAIILSVPYIFYILRYTKNSNVISKIYDQNREAIRSAARRKLSRPKINQSHFILFDTINQLQDLLQYVQFKEPKADIIIKMGKSLRFYLERKKQFEEAYFVLSLSVKNDISYKTLIDKYKDIERDKTFYEQKVLHVFNTSYHLLVQESHFDLASLCGNELYESGRTAIELGDQSAVKLVIVHFNTFIRFGINQALKTREIRNVYNTIFHYNQFINILIQRREEEQLLQCYRHFLFYGDEVGKHSTSEQVFAFLNDAFAIGLKKILIALSENDFSRLLQGTALKMFNELCSNEIARVVDRSSTYSNVRLVQIALCLFYIESEQTGYYEEIIRCMVSDLRGNETRDAIRIFRNDCERILSEEEEFWEETDQGNRNIFYSPHKDQMPKLVASTLRVFNPEMANT